MIVVIMLFLLNINISLIMTENTNLKGPHIHTEHVISVSS